MLDLRDDILTLFIQGFELSQCTQDLLTVLDIEESGMLEPELDVAFGRKIYAGRMGGVLEEVCHGLCQGGFLIDVGCHGFWC